MPQLLIDWINSHSGVSVDRFESGYLWIRSQFRLSHETFTVTERIPASLNSARAHLGY